MRGSLLSIVKEFYGLGFLVVCCVEWFYVVVVLFTKLIKKHH